MPLTRVLEPEVMDSREEARDYDAMDHGAVNRAFVDDLLAAGVVPPTADDEPLPELLDLGTGTALIPIELCRRCEGCRVMAVDLSVHMLEQARYNVEAEGLIRRIQLDRIDAKGLPYADGRFAAVISNSIVHHIPEPLSVLAEAVHVTRPGGAIFFRDLLRPDSDDDVWRLVELYAGNENTHSRQMFDDSLRAALSLDEIRLLVERAGFDGATVRQTSDRHWTWCAVRDA
jgi:ubiquinone/menaquinone biosynthesis C-methylase UbiE